MTNVYAIILPVEAETGFGHFPAWAIRATRHDEKVIL